MFCEDDARCLGCGCTESWGCDTGCAWVWVSDLGLGLCSNCRTRRTLARLRHALRCRRLVAQIRRHLRAGA